MAPAPSPDDDARETYGYGALFATALFASIIITLLAIVALAVTSVTTGSIDAVRYLISLFGALVGIYGMAGGLYFLLGPRLAVPFTPSRQPPDLWPIILFVLGLALVGANARVFSPLDETVYFWRVAAFALAGFLVTGISVYVILQYTGFDGFHRRSRRPGRDANG